MDIFTKYTKDTPKAPFRSIIRDDIDIGKRQISKSKSAESQGSEVDTLLYRLRRLEEVNKACTCNLKGSIDKTRDQAKVRFSNTVVVNFYTPEGGNTSVLLESPDFGGGQLRSEELQATHSILAKKRIPGFSSYVDTPADFATVLDGSCRDDLQSIWNQGQSNSKLPYLKSALKMSSSKDSYNAISGRHSRDPLYGQEPAVVESEADPPPSDSRPEPPTLIVLQDHKPGRRWRSLRSFLCCRRRRSPDQHSQSSDEEVNKEVVNKEVTSKGVVNKEAASKRVVIKEVTSNERCEHSPNVSEPHSVTLARNKSELAKMKYFRDHRKRSKDSRAKFVRFMKWTWK